MYKELSEIDPALPLVKQARDFAEFAREERIPLLLVNQIYDRYTSMYEMKHRPINADVMALTLMMRAFADGHPAGDWMAASCTETAFLELASPDANSLKIAGALVAIQLGFFVDGEILAHVRPYKVSGLAPPPRLRETWIRRRLIKHDGRFLLSEQDTATILEYSQPDFRRVVGDVVSSHGMIELGTHDLTVLCQTYPFLKEAKERGTSVRFFDKTALIACCKQFEDPRSRETQRILHRLFSKAIAGERLGDEATTDSERPQNGS